jgi:hypothetical protein
MLIFDFGFGYSKRYVLFIIFFIRKRNSFQDYSYHLPSFLVYALLLSHSEVLTKTEKHGRTRGIGSNKQKEKEETKKEK